MSPPYPNTTHRRAHQECPIQIRNTSIRSTPLFLTPEQLSSNRTPKNSAQAPDEKYPRIHSSILPDSKDLGDERRKQRVVPTGGEIVDHDESQPEREGGRGGAGEPEREDAGCGEEERQEERVLSTEAVAGVADQDARDGVDGVAGGEEVATFGGGEPEDYCVGGDKGEGELGAGRL